jgi:hypothetical protein
MTLLTTSFSHRVLQHCCRWQGDKALQPDNVRRRRCDGRRDLPCVQRGIFVQIARQAALLDASVALFPLVARQYIEPRTADIEFGEDVVAHLRLINRVG